MSQHVVTEPTFAELFTPKLVTVLREGYGFAHFERALETMRGVLGAADHAAAARGTAR